MTIARSLALGLFLTLPFGILLRGQASDSAPTRLRALGVVERPGRVPVFFVRSAEERALRLQKSIEGSHAWFEKQFGARVPIVLAVLDAEMYNKSFDLISTREVPTQERPRLIAMHDHQSGTPPVGADPDHASGGLLQGEQILFHDDGHAFFDTLRIGDIGAGPAKLYNRTVVEFVACIFEIAYMRSERPDLKFFLDDRRSRRPDAPRYATLADFDYLNGIDDSTYFWFMFQLERMADGFADEAPRSSGQHPQGENDVPRSDETIATSNNLGSF